MIDYAIVGFGNLGQRLAELLYMKEKNFVVYSRRKISYPPYTTAPLSQIETDRPHIAFLCCSSANDSLTLAPYIAKYCNTVDCFDNHGKVKEYVKTLSAVCTDNSTMSVVGAGWDPGLLSVMRAQLSIIAPPDTYWGKGVSLGHTNAVKSVAGVEDALCLTLPDKKAIAVSRRYSNLSPAKNGHTRLCYVAANENADKQRIRADICNMPDYFKGYKVIIRFVTQSKLSSLATTAHGGKVLSSSNMCKCEFSVSLTDNAALTAKIMYAYSSVIESAFSVGAYSVLQLPLSALIFDVNRYL